MAQAMKTVETAKNIDMILAEVAEVPQAIRDEQVALADAREGMKTWLDSVKKLDATGKWTGEITATSEEFNNRENELATKNAALQEKIRPILRDHELKQQARIAEELGKPNRNFGFGSGTSNSENGGEVKSLFDHIQGNDEFKSVVGNIPSNPGPGWGRRITLSGVDTSAIITPGVKTQLDTNPGGFPMPKNRTDLVVPFAHRRPVVSDIIPSLTISEQFFVYMEAITWANAAAMVAEGNLKPESALGWVERQVQLQVIAHTIPMTKQLLKYAPSLQMTVEKEMIDMLRLKEEDQIIAGTGTSPQLTGITTRSGIQTYARTTGENNLDAIFRSFQQIRFVGYAEPDNLLINPDNFTPIALLKDANGNYIYGDPASPQLQTIWGKPYTQTQAITAGTSLSGDFGMYTLLLRGSDVIVELGYVNDQFAKNALTMLCEEYVALCVKRAAAFSLTTNLNPTGS